MSCVIVKNIKDGFSWPSIWLLRRMAISDIYVSSFVTDWFDNTQEPQDHTPSYSCDEIPYISTSSVTPSTYRRYSVMQRIRPYSKATERELSWKKW
jgi:hypothetical protein